MQAQVVEVCADASPAYADFISQIKTWLGEDLKSFENLHWSIPVADSAGATCCLTPECLKTKERKQFTGILGINAVRMGPVVRVSFRAITVPDGKELEKGAATVALSEFPGNPALWDELSKALQALGAKPKGMTPKPPVDHKGTTTAQGGTTNPPPSNNPPHNDTGKGTSDGAVVAQKLPDRDKTSSLKLWGHVTFWSGVGMVALGGLGAGLGAKYGDDYKNDRNDTSLRDKSRSWTGVMWAGFGLGAALMATGVTLWLIKPSASSDSGSLNSAALVPTSDGHGAVVGLQGSW